ncbi:MAG TPA: heparinase II/III family protein, partial [Candidatus Limnocylindria bacterium]|nr:heparinase II/III family protein [Candidatus Limnocylindria bacterium]
MISTKLIHYTKRALQLGPVTTLKIIQQRSQTRLFDYYWRYKAQHHLAGHILDAHQQQHIRQRIQQQPLSFVHSLHPELLEAELIAHADTFVKKTFDLLGSGPTTFTTISWHGDFRLQAQNPQVDVLFDAQAYYKDIQITAGQSEELVKDIKVPWELSRCQHLYVLAKAYRLTKNQQYVDALIEHIDDWITQNPFLLGPNWVCPMEVGIRALNWIVALHALGDITVLPAPWLSRVINSLYDHMVYLENNWEIYDGRTSNHYLSDLVGYWYLCDFFAPLDGMGAKKDWCCAEILKEFAKQVHQDGTDYEGSTAYHGLVTELFYLFYVLCSERGRVLPPLFVTKLHSMFEYLEQCTTHGGNRVQIGDNDSGVIVWQGLGYGTADHMKSLAVDGPVYHYPQAGVSILKTTTSNQQWHVTLRHHAYQGEQPSGHFHNDTGSVTVAINGIDIFVDPGSYVYTPSAVWRNHFRSVQAHNTFFIEGQEPIAFDERLFALNIPENKMPGTNQADVLTTHHTLYAGLQAQRRVALDNPHTLTIED